MSVILSPIFGAAGQFFDNSGNVLSGGKIYTYLAGTTTPATTYTTSAGNVAHANPIVLNSAGRVATGEIWLTVGITYKFVLKTSEDVLLGTYDNIDGINDPTDLNNFIADLASTSNNAKGDALVGFKQANNSGFLTGAVGRTVSTKLQEFVSALDFGVVGDGTTNDTSKFVSLETDVKGQSVNLNGLVCLVDAIPNGNDYYNGAFKVGSNVYWMFEDPKQHPFDTTSNSITCINPDKNFYRHVHACYPNSNGKSMTILFSEAQNHGATLDKILYAYQSTDYGRTKTYNTNYVAAYSDDTYAWGTAASGVMGNNRFGFITGRVIPGGADGPPDFVYSDDNGASWNTINLSYGSSGQTRSYFHSQIYNWPSSVGGNDTTGWIAYAYNPNTGIVAWKTLDNGATWTAQLAVPKPSGIALSECSVARIGTQNKWVMVGRTGGTQAFACVSSDMLTWSTAQYIPNVNLRSNPPELIYDDGRLYFFGFSREGSKELQTQVNNALVVSVGNPDTVYNSSGISGWDNWRVVSNLSFWPTGYAAPVKLQNRWFFYYNGGEELAGGSTGRTGLMYLLSNDISESTCTNDMLNSIPAPNLFKSGQMSYWPCGTYFVSGASRQQVIPGMTFARSSGVSGATFTRVAGEECEYGFRMARVDGDTSTEPPNLLMSFTQPDSQSFWDNRVNISFRARCGAGFSGVKNTGEPKFLYVKVRYSDIDQQVVTSLSGTPVNDNGLTTNYSGVYLSEWWTPLTTSIGPLPTTAKQIFIQIRWDPQGTALDDWIEIEALKVEVGNISTPFVPISQIDVINWSNQFYQTKTLQTENGSRNVSLTQMCRVPSVTSATRASLVTNMVAANGDITLTARAPGVAGNSITIVYVDPGVANSPLSISLAGTAITVNLATDGSSVISSRANEIVTALNANTYISNLVFAQYEGTGEGKANAVAVTNLAGGTASTGTVTYPTVTGVELSNVAVATTTLIAEAFL